MTDPALLAARTAISAALRALAYPDRKQDARRPMSRATIGAPTQNGREVCVSAAVQCLRGRRPVNLSRKIGGGFTVEQVLTAAQIVIPV